MTGILEGEESIVGPTAIFVPTWCMEGEEFVSTLKTWHGVGVGASEQNKMRKELETK